MNILRDVIQEKFHYVDRLVILDINLIKDGLYF